MQWYVVAALLIAVLAVLFGLQNPSLIDVKFLFWEFRGSMALVLLLTFAFGFVASLLLSMAAFLKKKMAEKGDTEDQP